MTPQKYQGFNFIKFSKGHVGYLIKYFRSPQENLRAHNGIEFIFKSKNAETVKTVHGFLLHNATRNFYFVNIFVVRILN